MNFSNFTEKDIELMINRLFEPDHSLTFIETAYQKLTQTMCENFCSESGVSDIVLSRVYHSFEYSVLPPSLQQVAQKVWGDQVKQDSKFITLMGTYGDKPEWRDRTKSEGHKAILLSYSTITKIPMVARLLQQIGIDLGVLLGEKDVGIKYGGVSGTFGIFYVSPTLGSAYIPAQDFVKEYQIKSVVGTGVMLPQGDIAIYIAFSRVNIEYEIAANIASLMSFFWQKAFPLYEQYGIFSE